MTDRMVRDAIDDLSDLGVVVGWVPAMRYPALWIEEDSVIVLSADRRREELCQAVRPVLAELRRGDELGE